MKHTAKVTLVLLLIFLCSQFLGLLIINQYIDQAKSLETGKTEFRELEISGITIERPDVDESFSFIYIILAVLIGTGLVLLIIYFKKAFLWKAWYFLAVVMCLSIAFSAFLDSSIALFLAFVAGIYKVFKPNVIIHNLTELFVYGGLAVIFVPILNLFSMSILLILISVYDAYAVWQSKHMIKLAKFQTKSKLFAGLLIPYGFPKKISKTRKTAKKTKMVKTQFAVLGGGDLGFPLLFAGVILKNFWDVLCINYPPFCYSCLSGSIFL